jgi:hypothetical protein
MSSSQPHVNHFDHRTHTHFDHVLAGLHHLRLTHRERINRLEQEREDLEVQRAALVREFQKHADIHDVWYRSLEGYEDKTYPIESQMERARHYLRGMFAGTVIAVVLGVYFSVSTMIADSLPLFVGSVIVAVGIGVLASVILRAILGANSVRPHAAKGLNFTVAAAGVVFILMVTAFAWLRFQSDSPLVALLPSLIVGMELTAIIFAGACDCGYRMYRWSGAFHERHRQLLHREASVEDHLANRHVDLLSIEHRIKEHEEAHHGGRHDVHHDFHHDIHHEGHRDVHHERRHEGHHANAHTEEHHESQHATVHR